VTPFELTKNLHGSWN